MAKNRNIKSERFHYCPPMEMTEWEFFGVDRCPSGMASASLGYKYFRERLQSFIKKIEERIDEIVTNDEPLKQILYNDIKELKDEVKRISPENNNDIEIIAYLFSMIAHLLGWAYCDGKFHRTVIYYQTKEQQIESLQKIAEKTLPVGLFEAYRRRKIIKELLSEGIPYSSIALILGRSVTSVKQIEKAGYLDKMYNEVKDEI